MTALIALHAGLLRLASVRLSRRGLSLVFPGRRGRPIYPRLRLAAFRRGGVLADLDPGNAVDRPWQGIFWALLAGILHGTYLLGAAMLVFSYMVLQFRQKRVWEALLLGLGAALLVAPVVIYNAVSFAPLSADQFAEAQRILVHEPSLTMRSRRWCDGIALAQLAWILVALVLVRGSNLFVIMLLTCLLSLLLTLVQLWTGNDSLALLFPWRTSAILVPLATTIILTRLLGLLDPWLTRRPPGQALAVKLGCGMTLAVLVAGGVCIEAFGWGYQTNESELPMLEFVKAHQHGGEVYLLPVQVPKVGAGPRGASSTNFRPVLRAGKSGNLIAIDLQRFRLFTGMPIFVDFKSIPYKDVEVLEWPQPPVGRQNVCPEGLGPGGSPAPLVHNGISHVVTSAERNLRSFFLEMVYHDASYRIYRVQPPARLAMKNKKI